MGNSYRVTKYKGGGSAGGLSSPESEWASYLDVGAKVGLEEYLIIEGQYVGFVRDVCKLSHVDRLEVQELEVFVEETNYKDGQKIVLPDALNVVREVLREQIWCKLVSEKVEFHFGYDYYMYVICPFELPELLKGGHGVKCRGF